MRESRREHNPVAASSEEAVDIAAMLAPLEEQEGGADYVHHPNKTGAIIVDTAQLKLPKDLMEEEKQRNGFHLEPIVIFILILVLGFIAFIAYLISIEPPK